MQNILLSIWDIFNITPEFGIIFVIIIICNYYCIIKQLTKYSYLKQQ